MNKLFLSLFVVALLASTNGAQAKTTRHHRLKNEVERNTDLTESIDTATMERIKQRYLRASQPDLPENQSARKLPREDQRIGRPTGSSREIPVSVIDTTTVFDEAEDTPISMSMSMSMDMSMSMSMPMDMSMSMV